MLRSETSAAPGGSRAAALLLAVCLNAAPAAACLKAGALDAAPDAAARAAVEAIGRACDDGLRLLAEGRPGAALPLLRQAAARPELLARDLALPLAEALFGGGAPVEPTLVAWEQLTQPEVLVAARLAELVERLPHGRAAALLSAQPGRGAATLLAARAAFDAAEPPTLRPRRVSPDRVGVLLPLTGALAPLGRALLRGMRLALDARTTLVVRDTHSDPARTRGLVDTLAADGVIAVLGPVDRDASLAAGAAAVRRELPLVRLGVDPGAAPEGPWAIRAFLSRASEAEALVRHARSAGCKRFVVLMEATPFGRAVGAAFQSAAEASTGTPAVVVTYTPGSERLARELKGVAPARPDALLIAGHGPGALDVLRFLARDDVWTRGLGTLRRGRVQILGPSEWRFHPAWKGAARYVRGAVVASEWVGPDDPAAATLTRLCRAGYGHPPGVFEAVGWDALRLVIAARAPSRAELLRVLRRPAGFPGVLGKVRFDARGEPRRVPRLFRLERGAFVRLP